LNPDPAPTQGTPATSQAGSIGKAVSQAAASGRLDDDLAATRGAILPVTRTFDAWYWFVWGQPSFNLDVHPSVRESAHE
jgi:hypothetical protein